MGNTLFVAIKVGKTSLSEVMPYMLWYYGAILSGLLLVTFVPAVSLGPALADRRIKIEEKRRGGTSGTL